MKTIVISYSFTGNNEALANSIAAELTAERIRVIEPKRRTIATIILDVVFNRTPQVGPMLVDLAEDDLAVFVGPVWMGHVATPFRSYFNVLKGKPARYAFVSISGGALNSNPKIAGELEKRTGKVPAAVIDMHIADLLPAGTKRDMKSTSAYKLTGDDVKKLSERAANILRSL